METERKERILDLFFNEHLKQIDIAKILDVSKQYVSKILKADSRYEEVKQNKLKENAIKRKDYLKQYSKNYQRPKKEDNNSYEQLKAQQLQDSLELSYSSGNINDYAFAKWNISAYHRNSKGNLVLNKGLNVGFDVPRTINMNIKVPTQKFKNIILVFILVTKLKVY